MNVLIINAGFQLLYFQQTKNNSLRIYQRFSLQFTTVI